MELTVAYELGYKAYVDGNYHDQNPFDADSEEGQDWYEGFSDSLWDSLGDCE